MNSSMVACNEAHCPREVRNNYELRHKEELNIKSKTILSLQDVLKDSDLRHENEMNELKHQMDEKSSSLKLYESKLNKLSTEVEVKKNEIMTLQFVTAENE